MAPDNDGDVGLFEHVAVVLAVAERDRCDVVSVGTGELFAYAAHCDGLADLLTQQVPETTSLGHVQASHPRFLAETVEPGNVVFPYEGFAALPLPGVPRGPDFEPGTARNLFIGHVAEATKSVAAVLAGFLDELTELGVARRQEVDPVAVDCAVVVAFCDRRVDPLRRLLRLDYPVIVENGGAIAWIDLGQGLAGREYDRDLPLVQRSQCWYCRFEAVVVMIQQCAVKIGEENHRWSIHGATGMLAGIRPSGGD